MFTTLTTNKVFVYWNLHKQLWSVRDQTTRKVTAHLTFFCLANCQFVVNEKGRQRVIRTGHKNVHAGVTGYFVDCTPVTNRPWGCDRVTYNPQTHTSFKRGGVPIQESNYTLFLPNKQVLAVDCL
ncbi:hypothetical protein [Methylovulum miyakonense]|uniref:hypothetical protein n=1 Tax=Methylovulum miyakonense TaxID=645578 RepID=UPI0012ECAD9A|nr:hypothetical protein [Methylovulum miyakonense]